jgi:regulator of sigma E protease
MNILIFLFILGLLIIVHEFGHFIIAKRIGVRVDKFSLGFGPRLLKRKKGETEYSISLIPLGGFVKLAGDTLEEYKGAGYEYLAKPAGKRFWIIFFGAFLNYVLGFLCFWMVFFAGYPTLTTKIGDLLEGFGAKEAGLQVADKIVAVDGQAVLTWEDLQKSIQARKASSHVKLSVLRSGLEFAVDVNIKEQALPDQLGQKRNVGLIGVKPFDEVVMVRHGFIESFGLGINKTLDLTIMTYKALWRMISGRMSMKESMTGPLGIFYITSKAAQIGFIAVLHLVAILNISLAIFNLLPFPVLDGGHILFLGLEKIRGKALSIKADQVITQIGVTVIISLALFVTYNDFLRLFQDKIANFLNK